MVSKDYFKHDILYRKYFYKIIADKPYAEVFKYLSDWV